MPYTVPHLWISQFSPTSVLLCEGFCTTNWAHRYSKVLCKRYPKSLWSWGIIVLHSADSGEDKHVKHFSWHMWHQSRSTTTYPLHIKYQISCTFIQWHIYSNKNLNTDSCNINFPHPLFHISRPIILIEFSQLTKVFVANVCQNRLNTILFY